MVVTAIFIKNHKLPLRGQNDGMKRPSVSSPVAPIGDKIMRLSHDGPRLSHTVQESGIVACFRITRCCEDSALLSSDFPWHAHSHVVA